MSNIQCSEPGCQTTAGCQCRKPFGVNFTWGHVKDIQAVKIKGLKDEIERLRHELGLAREDLARFRAERSYVIGCNTGWEEAIEQAVKAIEAYAQRLVPDPANDRARCHVRYAADDVRALAAGKEGK